MSAALSYEYRLSVGDWSCDGHNMSEDFRFRSSHSKSSIINAYQMTEKRAGVGLTDNAKRGLCVDYKDNEVSREDIQSLRDAGCAFGSLLAYDKDLLTDVYEDGILEFDSDMVFALFMDMVKASLPDFEYEKIKDVEAINEYGPFNYHIGYGVFNG